MDLIQLKYFTVIAKEHSFSRAARKLNITQPALSISISKMEKELNCRLFDYIGNRKVLNENGEYLLTQAEKIIALYDETMLELESRANEWQKVVSVVFDCFKSQVAYLESFQAAFPNITILQEFCPSDNLINVLLKNKATFAFSNLYRDVPGLECCILSDSPLYMVVSKQHPMANKSSFTLADTCSETLILNPVGFGFHQTIRNIYQQADCHPASTVYALHSAIQNHLANGCFTLVSDRAVKTDEFGPNVVYIKTADPSCTRKIYLYWKKHWRMTKSEICFLNHVRKQ